MLPSVAHFHTNSSTKLVLNLSNGHSGRLSEERLDELKRMCIVETPVMQCMFHLEGKTIESDSESSRLLHATESLAPQVCRLVDVAAKGGLSW